jgi:TonB-dependent SusC/RagA subfamily outer membrane receptor
MIKKHLHTLLFALIAFLMISFRADTDPESNLLSTLINKVQNHYDWYPQQKAYLHIDKSDYNVDETIWFKAYVVDATTHRPDRMSTNLYVDLINPSGRVVQTRLLRLENGLAHGDFSFQDTIPEGRYKIRAYTNWMRNLGEEYFFSKDVYVSNPLFSTYATRMQVQQIKKGQRETRRNISDFDLSFHPEGGSLLAGVENIIGFKAINGLGMGVRIEGSLMDRKGNKLMDISSNYLGMGSFAFTPVEGEKYFVEAIFSNSSPRKYNLPESVDMGVNINIDHAGRDSIYIRLVSNIEPGAYPPNTDYHLFAHTRGKAKYTAVLDLKEKSRPHAISKDIFPSGVTHFTLFNANSNPVSERLIFINQNDFLDIDITGNPSVNQKREKVNAKIRVRDSEGDPVKAGFSLAVVKGTELLQAENILTELLLDSDLKGNIEDPSYYFENPQNFKEKELDDLMLTQGWRRFDWPTVLVNRKLPVQHEIQNGIEIGGKITREFFGLPLRDIKVTLTILNEFNDVFVTRSDLKGYFSFENLSYPDTVGVKIEAVRHSGKKNLVIIVDQMDPGNLEDMYYLTEQYLRKPGEEGRWVTEKTPEEIEKENDPFYEENNRYYRIHQEPNDVIVVDETMQNYSSVAQIIQGRVPGVMVSGDNIIIRGINSFYASTDPLFIVDGVPVDKGFAMNMNPYDIDRIEILKGPEAAIYGSRGANGVIAIFTKRGKYMLKGVVDFEMIGYHTPKEFYSPRYETVNPEDPFEDDRTTLYWEPNLITGENGEAEFSFYTSDIEGDYFIIVEGINQNGEPGVGKSTFRIR